MSKGFAFVVGYSIVLIVLFCTMCYLMSTVDPAPLKGVGQTKPNGSRRYFNLNIKPLIVDKLAVGDNAEYGLEKAKEDDFMLRSRYPFYPQTTQHISRILNLPDFSDIVTVVPPIWPPATEHQNLAFSNIDIDESKEKTGLEFEYPTNKGQRRSVEKKAEDKGPGIIIFKVLDDSGRPRIEIKLGDLTKKNITINKYKRNSKFSVSTASDYDVAKNNVLSDNSNIKIMSNDTVVIYDENSSQTGGKDYVHDVGVNDDKQVFGNTLAPERNISQTSEVKNSTSSIKPTLSENRNLNSTTLTDYTTTRNLTSI